MIVYNMFLSPLLHGFKRPCNIHHPWRRACVSVVMTLVACASAVLDCIVAVCIALCIMGVVAYFLFNSFRALTVFNQ